MFPITVKQLRRILADVQDDDAKVWVQGELAHEGVDVTAQVMEALVINGQVLLMTKKLETV